MNSYPGRSDARSSSSPDDRAVDSVFLGLDTASPNASIALGNARSILEERMPLGNSSSELLGVIDDLLQRRSIPAQALAGILCTAGPGSFTGLRIGLATVMGLGESLGCSVVALPTLWTQAQFAAIDSLKGPAENDLPITSTVSAHRGMFFVQTFGVNGGKVRALSAIEMTSHLVSGSQSQGLNRTSSASLELGQEEAHPSSLLVTSEAAVMARAKEAGLEVLDSEPLATCLVQLAAVSRESKPPIFEWDPLTLVNPIYAQNPAVATRPKSHPSR